MLRRNNTQFFDYYTRECMELPHSHNYPRAPESNCGDPGNPASHLAEEQGRKPAKELLKYGVMGEKP